MAIAPQDVKVFPGQNFSSAKLAKKVEELIDLSIQYLNNGKKGKKPIGLTKTSVPASNKISLSFLFTSDLVSADADLSQLLDIIKDVLYYRNEKQRPKAHAAWQKIKSIIEANYTNAGWDDVVIGVNNERDKKHGFSISLYK